MRISKVFVLLIAIICVILLSSPCHAQNMLRKLGRGVSNIATSAFEIPISIEKAFYSDGPMAAGTYGVLDGIYNFVKRTAVGAYEVITFPLPYPKEYTPIIEPEFLFEPKD